MCSKIRRRTIVLRSFGKFYGLPGVRLGFIVAAPDVAQQVRALVGDWPVSADAIALGRGAYSDLAWAERTRRRLARDAARLDGLLTAVGFEILGGTSLFRLAASPRAGAWFNRLAEQGVLVRPFAHNPHQLRFGLPPRSAWPRLAGALEAARP
jgi:cobalamin biosynthetic protein CobC